MKKRKDVDNKYKWNLKEYFSSDSAWEKELENFSKDILEISKYNNKLNERDNILNCLKMIYGLEQRAETLYVYANCLKDLNVAETKSQVMLNKIEAKITEFYVEISFVNPQLSKLSKEFLSSLKEDKDFEDYSKVISDIIREKEHTLTDEQEKLLSQVSNFSEDFYANFSNFENGDLKFNKVLNKKGKALPMDQNLASIYLRSNDEVLRQNAHIELNSAFGRFNNFLTSNYLANVKKDVFYAKVRKFNSALENALFYEEVDCNVYKKLVEKVENNLNLDHKYFEAKRKLLGLKTFKMSDVYYNPFKSAKKYTYEQAFETVCDALSILGEDYIKSLKQLNQSNKIDVFPTENKYNGAYKTSAYGKPPVVLLNFAGEFDDVSTIAHELGHAMHSIYSSDSQPMPKARYKIFLAEIASTVNETLLNEYMLNHAKTKKEQIFYINEFLSRFHATVYVQTMFASFEALSHSLVENQQDVSSSILNNEYLKLVKKYYGKKVKIFDCIKYAWSRIPHFYTAFYVYKYATGLITAINIVENLKDGTITVEDYKNFLSTGCMEDPLSLLKIVKVDLSKDETFDKAFSVMKKYISQIEKLTK